MHLGRGICSGHTRDTATRGTDGSLSGALEQESQNLPLASGSTGGLSVWARGVTGTAWHLACYPPPCLEVPPTSGLVLALCPSCPGTDLGLGVRVPWEGREALGQAQHLHSAPALSNLRRHNTQRWGWEDIRPPLPN